MNTTIVTADALEPSALRELFNEGFSGYLVPMHLDAAAFATHLERNDIALGRSPVLVEERPIAFALVGVRGAQAWIGGMGTVPAARRRGHAEVVLQAAVAGAGEHGCEAVWLEVIDGNRAAQALYEKLGFEVTRELLHWKLDGVEPTGPDVVEIEMARAAALIAARRDRAEPWQRADRALRALAESHDVSLGAVGLPGSGDLRGAAVYAVTDGAVSLIQIAAPDAEVAEALLRTAARGRPLRLGNIPAQGPTSEAMRRLGAELVVRQREMRLRLSAAGSADADPTR